MYKALSPFQSHLYLEQVTSPCNKAESAYGAGWHRGQTANFLHSARTEARRYFSAYQNKAIRHARSAPYFKFWHRGKTATTQRVTSPCTRFIYCNAPTFHFTLLIKVSGVRISDGSPKEKPNSYMPCNCWVFSFSILFADNSSIILSYYLRFASREEYWHVSPTMIILFMPIAETVGRLSFWLPVW